MTVNIEKTIEYEFTFDCEKVIRDVIETACDYVGCEYETEVFVQLTDNSTIHSINCEYRDMDKPTDVLSFPLIDYDTPGDFTAFDKKAYLFNPDTGELMLGDIIISVERALEQADLYNHSLEREIAFLTAHSMLHLFGYDHMEQTEMQQMEKMQEEILTKLNITR